MQDGFSNHIEKALAVAEKVDKSLVLIKPYIASLETVANYLNRYNLKLLGHKVLEHLSYDQTIPVCKAVIGTEATCNQVALASITATMLRGTILVAGFQQRAKEPEDIFARFAKIGQSMGKDSDSLDIFPLDSEPEGFEIGELLETLPTYFDRRTRLIFPKNQMVVTAIEQILKSVDFRDIYKSHEAPLANLDITKICPGLWRDHSKTLSKRALSSGICVNGRDFELAGYRLGIKGTAPLSVMQVATHYLIDKGLPARRTFRYDDAVWAKESIDYVFDGKYGHSPDNLFIENGAVKQFVEAAEKSKIKDVNGARLEILKELLKMVEEFQAVPQAALCPVAEGVWYTREFSDEDRASGNYISEFDFAEECRVIAGSSQGLRIFWGIVDHQTTTSGYPVNDKNWPTIKKWRTDSKNHRFTTVLSTQLVADILERINPKKNKPGEASDLIHIPDVGPKRLETLIETFNDGLIAPDNAKKRLQEQINRGKFKESDVVNLVELSEAS
jgi:hypothetical protein